jgi:hypothetical protein
VIAAVLHEPKPRRSGIQQRQPTQDLLALRMLEDTGLVGLQKVNGIGSMMTTSAAADAVSAVRARRSFDGAQLHGRYREGKKPICKVKSDFAIEPSSHSRLRALQ